MGANRCIVPSQESSHKQDGVRVSIFMKQTLLQFLSTSGQTVILTL